MKQIEYNLLEERWVRVRGQDYTVQEVSLPDALLHAHEYRDLAGELPTQDAAMLRLLLAVLHTVFSRVDENGTPAPFEETDDALTRWEELYRLEAQNTVLRAYARTNYREYFADCFDYWIINAGNAQRMERFRDAMPRTYAYFERLAEDHWGLKRAR